MYALHIRQLLSLSNNCFWVRLFLNYRMNKTTSFHLFKCSLFPNLTETSSLNTSNVIVIDIKKIPWKMALA